MALSKNLTATAYVVSRILCVPFWGLFYLLPIILYKDLHASSLQITLMVALKPLASLLSPYWSQRVHTTRERLIPNLIWGNIIKFTPFLFFPFIDNPWFYIFSFALHMALCRGTIPAWMELLKLNIPSEKRSKVCAFASSIDYLGVALLPLLFGGLLDHVSESWRWLFPLAALLGILSSYPISKISILQPQENEASDPIKGLNHLLSPWKSGWNLLKSRKDFALFQWGFFFAGGGLMIIQPALPKYFVDTLHLSYSDLLTAFAALKGIGFVLSSPLWVKFFNRSRIFILCAYVTCAAALFPLLLIFAKTSSSIIFIAYLFYGVMQGGSELSWKMSGSVFSKEKNSAPFSSVNVLAVGIRGLIFPFLGSLAFFQLGSPIAVLLLGTTLCLLGTLTLSLNGKRHPIGIEKVEA